MIYKKIILILLIFLMIGCGNNDQKISELIIDNKNIIMNVGESKKIIASIKNNNNYKIDYDSSNSDIITVNGSGEIYAKAGGDAKIFVSFKDDVDLKYDTVNVHVNGSSDIVDTNVQTIFFKNTNLLMKKGTTYKAEYTITPENSNIDDILFYSSNNQIASISKEGVITAKEIGTCILTAKARDNASNIMVTVIDDDVYSNTDILPRDIIVEESITIKEGEEKIINYSLVPSNATNNYIEIINNNKDIVDINNNVIKALKEGQATIIIKSLKISKTININVKAKEEVGENFLVLNSEKNVYMKACSTAKIDVKSHSSLTYTSNNNEIATVDNNGNIKALKDNSSTVITISDNKNNKIFVNVIISGSNCQTNNNNNNNYNNNPVDNSGNVDSSLMGSGSDEGFYSCKKASPNLTLKINGKTYGQDGTITMKKGETLTVNVLLPTKCGKIIRLTRTSADGQSNWRNYASAYSSPSVNRNNPATFVSGATGYKWIITAKERGEVILSQTAEFDVKTANGLSGNIKSMIRLHVKIIS